MSDTQKKIEQLETQIIGLKVKIARIESYLHDVPRYKDYAPIEKLTKEDEPLYEEAVETVKKYDRASASLIQRKLSIGYARAARIIDLLEKEGIVSKQEGSKSREVLIK